MTGTTLRPGTPPDAGLDADRMQLVDRLCRTWVEDGIHPALGVLVARRGVVALHQTYGVLGPEPDAPRVPLDAVWNLASVTKPITATAVMQLVEDGLVGLTRPVQEYVPEFTGLGKDEVCVHHLLTHTSGLRDDGTVEHTQRTLPMLRRLEPPDDTQHVWVHLRLATLLDWPLYRPPGEEMCYANLNYDLLGEIVRRVSGCSLSEFMRNRIFEVLGMKDTVLGLPEHMAHRLVRQSPEGLDPWFAGVMTSRAHQEAPMAFASGYSTLHDMAVFVQAFLNDGEYGGGRMLSPYSVGEMTRDQIPGLPARLFQLVMPEASWSYGWCVAGALKWRKFSALPPGSFLHGGGSGTFVWGDPSRELVGLFFAMCSYGEFTAQQVEIETQADLFVNAVMSGVRD